MITLKGQLFAALDGVAAELVYGHPRDFAALPLLVWHESQNREYAQAGAGEYLAEINYTLDLYAAEMEQAGSLFADVDARMRAAGFRREACAELYETDRHICHTSARYRALADAQGNIYQ